MAPNDFYHKATFENKGPFVATNIVANITVDTKMKVTPSVDGGGVLIEVSPGNYTCTVASLPVGEAVNAYFVTDEVDSVTVTVTSVSMDQQDDDASSDILTGTYTPIPMYV